MKNFLINNDIVPALLGSNEIGLERTNQTTHGGRKSLGNKTDDSLTLREKYSLATENI